MKQKRTKLRRLIPYFVCIGVLLLVFAVFGTRLVQWQIKEGASFLEEADTTVTARVSIAASRGEIVDNSGNALATNTTSYQVICRKPYMTDETINDTIHTVVELLVSRGEEWDDEIPIELDSSGNYQFKANSEEAVAFLKSKSFLNVNSYATADLCVQQLAQLYAVDTSQYTPAELLRILSVRYNMTVKSFATTIPYTLADHVSKETAEILQENASHLPGVTIQVSTSRVYENGTLAPHLLGFVGKLTQEEYEELSDQGYSYDDTVGKSGIEAAFESELRGTDGVETVTMNTDGTVAEEKVTQEPVQGNTVYTTLDSGLQQVALNSLAENVQIAHASASDCVAGAAVVLRVSDFAILAAASYPTYDLGLAQTDSDYYTAIATDAATPLFNRALDGAFMPGSVYKPAVASAALQEAVLTQSSLITCEHTYMYYAPSYMPTCMGWHNSINVTTALQVSCNVFFFETGRQLGIEKMDTYARHYGLGVTTGVEIGESEGTLASPEEREAKGGIWQPGDVIQAAIGQSDNAFTPLQLATYCATIANNGTRLKTHLVDKITDYTRTNVLQQTQAEVVDTVPVSLENLKIVQQGMRQVITSGTASSVFGDYGIAIAGKTGTAEDYGHSDNVTFIAYAPYDNPEIAVAVVLEYGAVSKCAMNVAKDIFDAYFYGQVTDASGNPDAPALEASVEQIQQGNETIVTSG